MYAPAAFRIDDADAAFDFIERYGFATLAVVDGAQAVLSQIPMLADRARRVLRGHLARANPHAALIDGRRQTAVFTGPNAYVSPDWYDDAQQVPTWNYTAVHVEGAARVVQDPAAVDAMLEELSDVHESRRRDLAEGRFWKLAKIGDDKREMMRKAIVAFEIPIETIAFKAKLSQNRSAEDRARVIGKLAGGDDNARALAAEMQAATRQGRGR